MINYINVLRVMSPIQVRERLDNVDALKNIPCAAWHSIRVISDNLRKVICKFRGADDARGLFSTQIQMNFFPSNTLASQIRVIRDGCPRLFLIIQFKRVNISKFYSPRRTETNSMDKFGVAKTPRSIFACRVSSN